MLSRKALGVFVFVLAEFYASALVIGAVGFGVAIMASILLGLLGMNLLRRNLRNATASPLDASNGLDGGADALVSNLADGALASVGASLLVVPGVISTVIGAVLLVPPTRRLVSPLLAGRVRAMAPPQAMAGADLFNQFSQGSRRADPTVVDVEVVDVDDASNGSTKRRSNDRSNPTADSVPPELR